MCGCLLGLLMVLIHEKVESILLGIAESHPQVLNDPGPSVVFMRFGADSIDFEIRAFMKDVGYVLAIKSEMNL